MVSMVTDHRVPKKYAGRLVLQEFDAAGRRMVGPVRDIYRADGIFLEGPHIFKRDGWYYLFSADTGTGEAHGQSRGTFPPSASSSHPSSVQRTFWMAVSRPSM